MGLDTSHGCWHGPYSAFSRFRDAVAVAAKEHYEYEPNYEGHPMRAFLGWWDNGWIGASDHDGEIHEFSDVLDVFFIHSDCDGFIFPQNAGALADRLDALVGYLEDDEPFPGYPSHRERLRLFVAGLRKADDEWDVVRFH